jgi:hyperosmotically inducible protein
MKTSLVIAVTLLMGIYGSLRPARAADPSTTGQAAQYPADDSGRNVRDRQSDTLTAGDESSSPSDIALAQKIRQQVVADASLSTMAHNVKIITVNGVVTLRGPVKTPSEKERVAATAAQIAGAGKVHNDLEIAQ